MKSDYSSPITCNPLLPNPAQGSMQAFFSKSTCALKWTLGAQTKNVGHSQFLFLKTLNIASLLDYWKNYTKLTGNRIGYLFIHCIFVYYFFVFIVTLVSNWLAWPSFVAWPWFSTWQPVFSTFRGIKHSGRAPLYWSKRGPLWWMGSNYSLMGNVVFMLYSHQCSCRVPIALLVFSIACSKTEEDSVGGLILFLDR